MLDILYEDDHLLFLNKQPGIVVQRGYDPDEPVLYEEVVDYVTSKNEVAYLLQRLDRGTSGVIFFSKQSSANPKLTRQFEKKIIRKTYLALVHGEVTVGQTIEAPLLRVGPISFGVRDNGKRAVTHLKTLASSHAASLVQLDLETGRTHQIRVHLAAISHPLVGDWLYGARDAARPMLHAAALDLRHPGTNEPMRVEATLPDDFVAEMKRRGIESSPTA